MSNTSRAWHASTAYESSRWSGGVLEGTRRWLRGSVSATSRPNLDEALARKDVDAVILCTPTQMHASQALACLKAGKHVQVEIPLADSLGDAEAVVEMQKGTGLVAMCGHTRRFNPSHQ